MKHVELTDSELKEVAEFWSGYLNVGGKDTEQPSVFQYEALNDIRFRDAFLLWQAGAKFPEPEDHGGDGVRFANSREAFGFMGPVSTDPETILWGIGSAIQNLDNGGDVEVEDTDAATVLTLSWLIWAMLLGRWEEGRDIYNGLTMANLKYANLKASEGDPSGITHRDPLSAFGMTLAALHEEAQKDPGRARDIAMECFSVQQGSAMHEYVLAQEVVMQLRRITQKEESNSERS
jgi:hypothetical protein